MVKRIKQDKVMLVDGDILVYSQVTNNEFIQEEHNELDEWWSTVNLASVKIEIQDRLEQLEGMLHCKETVIAFGSKTNFRKKLLPTYKASRSKRKPVGYFAVVDWCFENFTCTSVPMLEADDIIGVLHTRRDLISDETIIVSSDKDMKTVPGLLYNPDEIEVFKPTMISEKDALLNLATQSLSGDPGDGYRGCPGIGPVKARAALLGKIDEALEYEDPMSYLFWEVIYDIYKGQGCPGSHAVEQCQMARILRGDDVIVDDDDSWDFKVWEPEGWDRKKHN